MVDLEQDFLDCSRANQGVWLLKVPNYVKEAWERAGEDGNVGIITIKTFRQTKKKQEISFTLNAEIAGPGGEHSTPIPLEHRLSVNPADRQQMFAFTEREEASVSSETGLPETEPRFAVVGRVAQRADCRPVESRLYMNMKRQHIEASSQPTNTVQQLERVVNSYKPVIDHPENIAYDEEKKRKGKRDRKDKAEVQDLLFKCFELHQYWAFTDLVKKTKQPPTFLKEILNEICRYNTKNPHKNTWELKEEYRHYSKNQSGSSDI
ncbi:general transcription factor IIF subunit 2-like isoform X2 [Corticium candelabrum]|uniref:general transcription factor IIF subunit 2-like isoform X2 n=1 Tax=Corticium candelabrum TaxID=121492 RepID=UPI002E258649|nr:general transcription factor IIF subunit 2-like isoform X2 [Corticium candelabrum]